MNIERITSAADGSELEFSYFYRNISITEDGRYVTFLSTSPELTDDFPDGGLNPGYHFIHDTETDETIRIPVEIPFSITPNFFTSGYRAVFDGDTALVLLNGFQELVYTYDFSTQELDTTAFPENNFNQQTHLGDSVTTFTTVFSENFDFLGPNVSRTIHTVTVHNTEGVIQRVFEIDDPGYEVEQIGPTSILYNERVRIIPGASNDQFVVVSIDLSQQNVNDVTPNSTGRQIAFQLSSDLAILNVGTGSIDRIVQNNTAAQQFSLNTPEYQFDPDDVEITSQGVVTPPRVGTLDILDEDSVTITPDGRFVIFESGIEGSGPNGILVFDRTTSQTENIAITANGTPAAGDFLSPDVSDDGRFVTFLSNSDDLGGPTNSNQFVYSVYVHDRNTGATELVSRSLTDEDVFVARTAAPQISGDGSSIVFLTSSGDVVEGDTNNATDIFVADNPFFSLPTDGPDVLQGTTTSDLIFGLGGNDTLFGGNGFDTINAGNGNDEVYGGNGRDLIFLNRGNDVFFDNDQGDVFGRDTVFGGFGNDTIQGGNGDDEFRGENGNDVINGRLGNDTIYGGDGFDTISAGDGNDEVHGGNGRDLVFLNRGDDLYLDNEQGGDSGRDTVFGGFGNDTVEGGNGDDVFYGEDGNDVINARRGNDTIFGGDDFDTISAGEGNDQVYGGNGRDLVFLNQGDDIFFDNTQGGQFGSDTVFSGQGNDTMQGGSGDDLFFGEAGNDLIISRLGNDTLYGGAGADTLIGGDGADTFVFRAADAGTGVDLVRDFVVGSDIFQLNGTTAANVTVNLAAGPNALVVAVGGVTIALLEGDDAASLTVDDILFA